VLAEIAFGSSFAARAMMSTVSSLAIGMAVAMNKLAEKRMICWDLRVVQPKKRRSSQGTGTIFDKN